MDSCLNITLIARILKIQMFLCILCISVKFVLLLYYWNCDVLNKMSIFTKDYVVARSFWLESHQYILYTKFLKFLKYPSNHIFNMEVPTIKHLAPTFVRAFVHMALLLKYFCSYLKREVLPCVEDIMRYYLDSVRCCSRCIDVTGQAVLCRPRICRLPWEFGIYRIYPKIF